MSEEKEVVYAVYGNEIESAKVLKRTEKQVKFAKRTGLAFGCVAVLPANDRRLAPTRAEAVRRAIEHHQAEIKMLKVQVVLQENRIGKLREMLAKEIAKDQPKLSARN